MSSNAALVHEKGVLPMRSLADKILQRAKVLVIINLTLPYLEQEAEYVLISELKAISQIRSSLLKSLNNHNAMLERVKKADMACKFDPWLNERIFLNQVRSAVEEENRFQQRMISWKKNFREFDGIMHKKLKEILSDLVVVHAACIPEVSLLLFPCYTHTF